jgi:ornithine cyclodeaminase
MKFMDMVGNGTLNMAELEDLGQIVAGDAPGRTNEDEIIMLSVGGMPVEDVAWATVIYRNAIANEIGVPLNLWEKPAMS